MQKSTLAGLSKKQIPDKDLNRMVSLEGDPKKLSRKRGSERGRERSP